MGTCGSGTGPGPAALSTDLRDLILRTREGVARAVDSGLTTLYWHVGRRIRQDILGEKRADYGEQIVSAPSAQLEAEFGRGFSRRNLFNMVRFAEVFPDPRIVQPLAAQLSWTHFSLIIYLDGPLQRDFYAEMSRIEQDRRLQIFLRIGVFESEKIEDVGIAEDQAGVSLSSSLSCLSSISASFAGLRDSAVRSKSMEPIFLPTVRLLQRDGTLFGLAGHETEPHAQFEDEGFHFPG